MANFTRRDAGRRASDNGRYNGPMTAAYIGKGIVTPGAGGGVVPVAFFVTRTKDGSIGQTYSADPGPG
ncbi:hypothetical protein, partial [Aureimonas phyllosphaerae]